MPNLWALVIGNKKKHPICHYKCHPKAYCNRLLTAFLGSQQGMETSMWFLPWFHSPILSPPLPLSLHSSPPPFSAILPSSCFFSISSAKGVCFQSVKLTMLNYSGWWSHTLWSMTALLLRAHFVRKSGGKSLQSDAVSVHPILSLTNKWKKIK